MWPHRTGAPFEWMLQRNFRPDLQKGSKFALVCADSVTRVTSNESNNASMGRLTAT